MKKTFIFCCFLFVLIISSAEAQKFRGSDKSAMDISYYPDNYAHDRKFAPELIGNAKAMARVTYSRPTKNGREVFGKLIPYGKVWRTGANEATEIKFYQDATIQGKKVKAGTYTLFTIPGASEWTIILNSDMDHWGAYSYNEASDVLRVNVPAKKSDEVIEVFSIQFAKGITNNTVMSLGWDNTVVDVPISF